MIQLEPKRNVRKTTYEVLKEIPSGTEFSSHQLRLQVIREIARNTGQRKAPFHDTVLRYLREKRHELDIQCTSRKRSTYIKRGA